MNAITYKEDWSYIQSGDLWLGVQSPKRFIVGDTMPDKAGQTINQSGKREQAFGNILWFTNLYHAKRHEELITWKKYSRRVPHLRQLRRYRSLEGQGYSRRLRRGDGRADHLPG